MLCPINPERSCSRERARRDNGATLGFYVSQRSGAPRAGVAYRRGSCVVSKFEVDLNASRPVGTASAVIAEEVDGQGGREQKDALVATRKRALVKPAARVFALHALLGLT